MDTGLDQLAAEVPPDLRGARVGLLTHAAGVARDGESAANVLSGCPHLHLDRLFAPEHGLRGERDAGAPVADGLAGVPVHSLYGRTPGPQAFSGLDAVLVDLQDIGCRYFTFAGTMRRLLSAAAASSVPVWVLDRPNPLGGAVAGPASVAPALRSLVAAFDVPIRHGRTIGELALLAAREEGLPPAALHVLPVRGWRRGEPFAAWGRPWVPPSPNSTGAEMAELYPGTCLVEGTNLSEGRGTPYPFRQIGAPWCDAQALRLRVAPLLPAGIRARAVWFVPTASKHAGQVCQGLFFDLEPGVQRAPDAALLAAAALLHAAADHPRFALVQHGGAYWLDRLTAGSDLRIALGSWAATVRLLADWRAGAEGWAGGAPPSLYAP